MAGETLQGFPGFLVQQNLELAQSQLSPCPPGYSITVTLYSQTHNIHIPDSGRGRATSQTVSWAFSRSSTQLPGAVLSQRASAI